MFVAQPHCFPRRMQFCAGVLGLLGVAALTPVPASATIPRYADILPLSQVKPGMIGYGLTTFKGTTISRFQVQVIGILKKENAGHDLILIKMKGGPITERGANLIQGMSGSPIYLKGKVAGAFSMGEQFPKEPVGMVTPIEDMLDAWDPNIPQKPSYFQPAKPALPHKAPGISAAPSHMRSQIALLPHPIDVDGRQLRRLVLNARADDPRQSTPDTAVLRRATTLLSVTGISDRDRAWFQKELDQRGYAITVQEGPGIGVGSGAHFAGAPLRPGSAFGTFLATGDIEIGATGTITYRRGERILGYGHPLFSLGALEGAITSASIVDIFSGVRVSHHIAVAGPVVGTLTQDRDFSVSAVLGRMPHLVPFDLTVNDHTTGRSKVFHAHLLQHPDLTATLLRLIAKEAITEVHNVPGDVMAQVTTTVDAAEVGRVTRSNLVFDSTDISAPATQDLGDLMNIVSGNPFYPLPVHSAHMTVDITNGHNTATVERIFLRQGRYAPGDTLDIGVVLKPYRQDPITRTLSLKIPSDTPTGRYPLTVRGGVPMVTRFGPFILGNSSQEAQTPPVNVTQMVAQLNEREVNTDIVGSMVLNTIAPALEGEKLSQLPPNISTLMRSDRNSGVRLERDSLRGTVSTPYVLSGSQQLQVTVVRKNTQEPTGSTGFNTQPVQPATGGGITPFQSSFIGASNNDESATEEAEGTGQSATENAAVSPSTLSQEEVTAQATHTPPADTKKKRKKTDTQSKTTTAAPTETSTSIPTAPATTITSAPADSGNDRPVGRQMQVWRQTAIRDFSSGELSGVSVTANGALRLAPTLRRLASSTETYIWSLVADGQGNLYAGTGTTGKVLKIDTQGKISTFATLPVISIQSLFLDKQGTLWAGSSVKGALYRISPGGEATLACTVPDKYILALAQDSQGNLYIGPGGGGTVYRVDHSQVTGTGTVTPVPYLKTSADHIMALALDKQDNLYVGTGNEGILYKVNPDGKSNVLYDAKENAITSLAVDNNGLLYAGTFPKGIVYRIAPNGIATTVFDRAASSITALKFAPDGALYAASVNALYRIQPSASEGGTGLLVQPFDNPREVDFLSLAVLPGGELAAGTGNIGEIYTSAPETSTQVAQTGTYESVVHDAHLVSHWGLIRWNGTVPATSHVHVETRTGNVAEPDATWSNWTAVRTLQGNVAEGRVESPPARFFQYRILLESPTTSRLSPAINDIALDYMPRNQPPKVTIQVPAGGERWARTQVIRWSASDPDNDTLSYDVLLSSDGGTSWKSITKGSGTDTKTVAATATPSSGVSVATPNPAMEQLNQLPDSLKQAILAGIKRQQALKSDTTPAVFTGTLRETSKSWDTTTMPDGVYWIKVIASDQMSNPTDAQTTEAISAPFLICNAPPELSLTPNPATNQDRTVTVQGTVQQPLIAVVAVQYRIDRGEWIAATPRDGLFDSSYEGFSFTTLPLPSGKHTIEVLAFNAAGNKTTQKLDVTSP